MKIFYPKFSKEEVIKIISERIKELEDSLPIVLVILFGSYAKGNYTVGSDVDLLVVYKGEVRNDAYAIVKKTVDIPRLEPHLYTEDEYKKMKDVLNRMTKGGIVLYSRKDEDDA
ncbi:MAG: nucleotidyltransferase domain-containing protein [Dictyoglomaceae bacterium]